MWFYILKVFHTHEKRFQNGAFCFTFHGFSNRMSKRKKNIQYRSNIYSFHYLLVFTFLIVSVCLFFICCPNMKWLLLRWALKQRIKISFFECQFNSIHSLNLPNYKGALITYIRTYIHLSLTFRIWWFVYLWFVLTRSTIIIEMTGRQTNWHSASK